MSYLFFFPFNFLIYLSFSSDCQSVDPGQQFTWEHSNLEVNKPKNRYANVIAYDHSRVILTPLDGEGYIQMSQGRGLCQSHDLPQLQKIKAFLIFIACFQYILSCLGTLGSLLFCN